MPLAFAVVKPDGPRANCAKPEHLTLVDAAFAKPGGPEAQRMKRDLCTRCPVGEACLEWAMINREDGIWGGHGPKGRTQHGAPGKDGGGRASFAPRSHAAYQPVAAADVPVATLRAWALAQGLPVHPSKGRISETIREQYVAAHEQQAS